MFRKKLATLAVIGTLLVSLAPNASVYADSKVEKKQAEVNKYQSEFKRLSDEVKKIDKEIASTKKKIEAKKAEIVETQKIISDKNTRITYLQDRIEKRNEILEDRLIAMQEQPKVNLVTDVLLNADGIVDFFNRLNSINTLFEADQKILDEQESEQDEVKKEKALVNEKKNSLVKSKEELVTQEKELSKSQASKQESLKTAENNLKLAVSELENAKEDERNERIRELERQSLEIAELSNDGNSDDDAGSNSGSSRPDSNSGSNSGSSNNGPIASGNAIVDFAMKYQGVPYVFGGTSPKGFDCSGYIWYVYSHNGYNFGRANVKTYWSMAKKISSPQPGDLVFLENTYISGPSHVGIYIGGNKMIHAGSKGISVISLGNSWVRSHFLGYGKF